MIRLMTCACQALLDAKVKVEPGLPVPETLSDAGGSQVSRSRASGSQTPIRAMKTGESGWPLTEEQVVEVFAKGTLYYNLLAASKMVIYDSRDSRNEFWADMDEEGTVRGTKKVDVYASTHVLLLPSYYQVNNAHGK